jgi:hypothetical protein
MFLIMETAWSEPIDDTNDIWFTSDEIHSIRYFPDDSRSGIFLRLSGVLARLLRALAVGAD